MSTWTNITGAIRIDSFLHPIAVKPIEKEIKKILGEISTWEKPISEKKHRTPTGSEGGIEYDYKITVDDDGSISRGIIYITGDLRDYGEDKKDITDIVDWLNGLTDNLLFFIHQGIVQIKTYHGGIIEYSEDEKKFILKE